MESEAQQGLFRDEALRHHLGEAEEGAVLKLSPSWMRWTYWLLLLVVAAGLVYLIVGEVPVYEAGPAVLRIDDAVPLAVQRGGSIASVEVMPGQQVSAGQVLVRLRADQERAELTKIRQEFELQLVAHLRDPGDALADRELRRLRPELERARQRLDQTVIRATSDGAVQDVRIRPGDYLEPGVPTLSLVPVEPSYSVIAFLPGHALPQLEDALPVRLKITGYPYAHVATVIDSVGTQAIGPSEARRFVGPEISDTFPLSGPVVLVRCRLDSDRFVAGRQEYRVHDGMRATAEVEVRTERILHRLIPGLKGLGARNDA